MERIATLEEAVGDAEKPTPEPEVVQPPPPPPPEPEPEPEPEPAPAPAPVPEPAAPTDGRSGWDKLVSFVQGTEGMCIKIALQFHSPKSNFIGPNSNFILGS